MRILIRLDRDDSDLDRKLEELRQQAEAEGREDEPVAVIAQGPSPEDGIETFDIV